MNTKPKFCSGRGSSSVRIIKMFLKPHYVGQIELSNEVISVSEGRRSEAVKRKISADLYTSRIGSRTHSKPSELPFKRKLEVGYDSSFIVATKRAKRSSRKGYLFRAEETKLVSRTFAGVFSARIHTTFTETAEYQFSKSNDRLCDQEVESIMQEVQTLSLECKLESVECNLKDPVAQRNSFKECLLYGSVVTGYKCSPDHTPSRRYPDFLRSALKHEMNYNFMKDLVSAPDTSVHINPGKAETAIEVADIIQTGQSNSCGGSTLLYAIDGVFVVLIIFMVILIALTY